MFQALKNYLNSSDDKVITRDELVTISELTFTAISKNVLPALKAVSKSQDYFETPRINVLENLGGSLGLRTSNPKEVIAELSNFFKDIVSEERNFIKLVNTQTNDKIFPALATAQEVAIMKTITDISSVTLYVLDLLYYIVLDGDTVYPKKKIEVLKLGVPQFSSIVKIYIKDFPKHVSTLYKVAKTEIKADASTALMDKLLSKHGKLVTLPILNGFIHNPIYHIRVWLVDRDVAKYEALKEKKKLIELKLLELKLKSEDTHDESLAKQIAYYEDKISGMEYDIKELGEA